MVIKLIILQTILRVSELNIRILVFCVFRYLAGRVELEARESGDRQEEGGGQPQPRQRGVARQVGVVAVEQEADQCGAEEGGNPFCHQGQCEALSQVKADPA